MSVWTCKAGDLHRRITLNLSGITTSGASGVTFRMRSEEGGALVVNAAGVLTSSSQVSYTFTGTQLDTAGRYNLEASLTFADGTETVPTSGYVTVIVEPKLT